VLTLLFKLLIAHAFADFAFQSDAIGKGKNRHNKTEPPPGAKFTPCWIYYLTAHSLIHGGMVYLVTGSALIGILETVAHWIIDFGKCDNRYGVHVDQLLHLTCKFFWIGILL
jgi:hypothetical protein